MDAAEEQLLEAVPNKGGEHVDCLLGDLCVCVCVCVYIITMQTALLLQE